MSIRDQRALEVSRKKLKWLEERHQSLLHQPAEDAHVRTLTLRSLTKQIQQFRQEISHYEQLAKHSTDDHVQAGKSG